MVVVDENIYPKLLFVDRYFYYFVFSFVRKCQLQISAQICCVAISLNLNAEPDSGMHY